MRRTQGIAAALTIAIRSAGAPAFAADLGGARSTASIEASEQRSRWEGFYLGLSGGYGWGKDEKVSLGGSRTQGSFDSISPSGGLWGALITYNAVYGHMLLGVEADLQFGDIQGSSSSSFGRASTEINGLATVRGRLGYTYDRALFFVTGGYARAAVDSRLQTSDDIGISLEGGVNGFIVGAGVEYALSDRWSIKAEYDFVNLSEVDFSVKGVNGSLDPDFHMLKFGLNYRF